MFAGNVDLMLLKTAAIIVGCFTFGGLFWGKRQKFWSKLQLTGRFGAMGKVLGGHGANRQCFAVHYWGQVGLFPALDHWELAEVEAGGIHNITLLAEQQKFHLLALCIEIAFLGDFSYQQHYLSFLEDY